MHFDGEGSHPSSKSSRLRPGVRYSDGSFYLGARQRSKVTHVERQELELFRDFYKEHYEGEIQTLARQYPNEGRSLYVEYGDLRQFDAELAERYLEVPDDVREIAEEALRTCDFPAEVSMSRGNVRLRGLPSSNRVTIRGTSHASDCVGSLVTVEGIVESVSNVSGVVTEAAFDCQ